MARKGGQRHAAAALCAAMAWSFFATPVAASAALHFGTPTKLSRMSFDVTAYPASFFEASYISRNSENETLAKYMASHRAPRSVAAIECALATDEHKTIRLRGGERRRWKME